LYVVQDGGKRWGGGAELLHTGDPLKMLCSRNLELGSNRLKIAKRKDRRSHTRKEVVSKWRERAKKRRAIFNGQELLRGKKGSPYEGR